MTNNEWELYRSMAENPETKVAELNWMLGTLFDAGELEAMKTLSNIYEMSHPRTTLKCSNIRGDHTQENEYRVSQGINHLLA